MQHDMFDTYENGINLNDRNNCKKDEITIVENKIQWNKMKKGGRKN